MELDCFSPFLPLAFFIEKKKDGWRIERDEQKEIGMDGERIKREK